jgi:hypothetical protein
MQATTREGWYSPSRRDKSTIVGRLEHKQSRLVVMYCHGKRRPPHVSLVVATIKANMNENGRMKVFFATTERRSFRR